MVQKCERGTVIVTLLWVVNLGEGRHGRPPEYRNSSTCTSTFPSIFIQVSGLEKATEGRGNGFIMRHCIWEGVVSNKILQTQMKTEKSRIEVHSILAFTESFPTPSVHYY